MKGDKNMVREVYMDLNSMVHVGTKVVDKENYTRLGYLVDNVVGKHRQYKLTCRPC